MALINAKSGIAIAICLSLALLLSGCALTFDPRDTAAKSLFPAGNGSGTLPDSNSLPSSIVLSLQEIAKHSSASDCWVAINGKVLDLSDFTSHPGGSAYIPYCGTDGTAAYDRQGHSSAADAMLADYFIGNLGDVLNSPTSGTVQPPQGTDNNSSAENPVPAIPKNPAPAPPKDSNTAPISLVLSLQEVARHNSTGNCWMVINSNVLNLSDFTNHPGGADYIPYCGTDGTAAYDRQGHSSAADALMASYIIGSLGQTVQISQPSPTASPPSSNPSPPPRRGGDDDDGDDD